MILRPHQRGPPQVHSRSSAACAVACLALLRNEGGQRRYVDGPNHPRPASSFVITGLLWKHLDPLKPPATILSIPAPPNPFLPAHRDAVMAKEMALQTLSNLRRHRHRRWLISDGFWLLACARLACVSGVLQSSAPSPKKAGPTYTPLEPYACPVWDSYHRVSHISAGQHPMDVGLFAETDRNVPCFRFAFALAFPKVLRVIDKKFPASRHNWAGYCISLHFEAALRSCIFPNIGARGHKKQKAAYASRPSSRRARPGPSRIRHLRHTSLGTVSKSPTSWAETSARSLHESAVGRLCPSFFSRVRALRLYGQVSSVPSALF